MFWKKKPPAPVVPPPPTEPEPPPPPPPERRFTDRLDRAETVIAPGIRIAGDIEGRDAVEIAGQVKGKVTVRAFCHVQAGGELRGPLNAAYAIIAGKVLGKVTVRRKVEIRRSAHVEADIRAEGVAMAEGCFFEGRIHMQGSQSPGGHHSFEEKRRVQH
jgi:cytoskeletal protein CcmA (bactofilin family)